MNSVIIYMLDFDKLLEDIKNKSWKDYNLGRGDVDINRALKGVIPFIK